MSPKIVGPNSLRATSITFEVGSRKKLPFAGFAEAGIDSIGHADAAGHPIAADQNTTDLGPDVEEVVVEDLAGEDGLGVVLVLVLRPAEDKVRRASDADRLVAIEDAVHHQQRDG